jgi:hypothetical protein
MAAGLLKKKKEETPLKDFVNDLKNNSKVVNATNMAVVQSALSTLKTLPNLVDYAFVSGISAYLMYCYLHIVMHIVMYYYMQNYECNM